MGKAIFNLPEGVATMIPGDKTNPDSVAAAQRGAVSSCPYLGLRDDPATAMAFSSIMNRCYRSGKPRKVSLEYQSQVCFGEYTECRIYQRKYHADPKKRKLLLYLGLVAAGVVLLVTWGMLQGWPPFKGVSETVIVATPFPATNAPATESAAATESPASSSSPSPPSPPSFVPSTPPAPHTGNPTVFLPLDTPIGTTYKFLIHRVREGESLSLYLTLYNTSVDAIRAVNRSLTVPLWVNQIVIIPLNIGDIGTLPVFDAYEVVEDINASQLAERLSAELGIVREGFLSYNALSGEETILKGSWVLIPYLPPIPMP
jgi:hypothetical protein